MLGLKITFFVKSDAQGLEYCEERYCQDLNGIAFPLRAQASNTRLIGCKTIEKFRHHPDREDSVNEGLFMSFKCTCNVSVDVMFSTRCCFFPQWHLLIQAYQFLAGKLSLTDKGSHPLSLEFLISTDGTTLKCQIH